MQIKEFESVLGRIQQEGGALEGHLMSLLRYVDEQGREEEPIDLEKLSLFLKENKFEFVPKLPNREAQMTNQSNPRSHTCCTPVNVPLPRDECIVEDLDSKLSTLETLGKGFSKFDMLKIAAALRKTAANPLVAEVYFFGKIFGTNKDYYVIWTIGNPQTPNGDVLDSINFEVSSDCHDWTTLPKISPHIVRKSRSIKAMFTGKLDHQVAAGLKEADYLHAVLFRILFSNMLIPDGFMATKDDSEYMLERNQEYKPAIEPVKELAGWVHRFAPIMKYGNTIHPWMQEEEVAQKMELVDPMGKPLGVAGGDNDVRKWEVRVVNGNASYGAGDEGQAKKGTDVIGITNDVWPGALTYYGEFEEVFGFVYIGFGLKGMVAQPMIELKVAAVNQDVMKVGLKDYKEPNPEEGKEVLETDSEPEKDQDEDKNEAD